VPLREERQELHVSLANRVKLAKIKNPSKILIVDIERLPGLAKVWQPKVDYIAPRNFVQWPRLLCLAARWYGQKEMMFAAEWEGREQMVRTAWDWYDQADIVVTFNGIRFDNKHLKTEWLELGMKPPRPWRDVDLFPAVKTFGFESRSLDSVTRRLGRPGKAMFYDMEMAQAAVDGDEKAQRRLRRYNAGDVELTEWLYDRLRGWIPTHPFIGVADNEAHCNQCGSTRLVQQPSKYRAVVIDYNLLRCADCGGLVRSGWHSRVASTRGVR
jgi:hypothetical protein